MEFTNPKKSKDMVSECCGAELEYYSNAFIPLPNGNTEGWVCSKCHKPTKPVKAKEKGE